MKNNKNNTTNNHKPQPTWLGQPLKSPLNPISPFGPWADMLLSLIAIALASTALAWVLTP